MKLIECDDLNIQFGFAIAVTCSVKCTVLFDNSVNFSAFAVLDKNGVALVILYPEI
jgi:hypothetical protein